MTIAQNSAVSSNNAMAAIVSDATAIAKGKVANYTTEDTVKLLADYASGTTIEDLAVAFGKTTRSIVAKLSREKVYVKKEYVTKAGEKPVSKEDIVAELATLLGLKVGSLDSLEKANKTVLNALLDGFNRTAELFDAMETSEVSE